MSVRPKSRTFEKMFLQRLGRCIKILKVSTTPEVLETSAQPRLEHSQTDTNKLTNISGPGGVARSHRPALRRAM